VELVEVEDRAWGLIGAEESLDGDLDVAGGEVVTVDGEAEDGVVDGAEDLAAEAAVHLVPDKVLRAWRGAAVDVVAEAELAAHRLEEERLAGVVGGLHLQLDRHMGLDGDRGEGWNHEVLGDRLVDGCHGAGSGGGHGAIRDSRHGGSASAGAEEAPRAGAELAPRAGEDEEPSVGMDDIPRASAEGSPVSSDMLIREGRRRCRPAAQRLGDQIDLIAGGGWAAEKERIRLYTM
jgi:hypothetical protein